MDTTSYELTELQRPDGRRLTASLQDWQIYMGMIASLVNQRAYIAAHVMASMIANPKYDPLAEPGEDAPQAYARRATDYADALTAELYKREAAARAARKEETP